MAQIVDDGSDRSVGTAYLFQQGSGVGSEQTPVVGRQADGGVAHVDDLEEIDQAVVVVGRHGRVGVPLPHPAGNVFAHPLPQAVVVVTPVVDRQQPPVLGVEQEEQAVEENEGGVPDLREAFPRFFRCQGIDQAGEDLLENHTREILRHLLLVASPLGQRRFQEGGRGPFSTHE